tara:strand:+ start:1424 stop:2560 length:1137 start_codon:yes stop_codon:yes gene_type:complete
MNDGIIGILMEPEVTNILPYGEKPGDSNWFVGQGTFVEDAHTSPDGAVTATEAWANNTFGVNSTRLTAESFISGDTYTFSAYVGMVGATNNEWHRLNVNISGTNFRQYFNVRTGEIGTNEGTAAVNPFSEGPDSRGYYRIGFSFEANDTATATPELRQSNADGDALTDVASPGNGQKWWGAQVENFTQATSVIITSGATAQTRVEDSGLGPAITRTSNTLGAFSYSVELLAGGAQAIASGGRTAFLDSALTTYCLFSDGGGGSYPDGDFQSNAGAGGGSMVTGISTPGGRVESFCWTYDASKSGTFPGEKRYAWINGNKYQRANDPPNDDTFTAWPASTGFIVGPFLPGSTLPCIARDFQWWPELSDDQAEYLSRGNL